MNRNLRLWLAAPCLLGLLLGTISLGCKKADNPPVKPKGDTPAIKSAEATTGTAPGSETPADEMEPAPATPPSSTPEPAKTEPVPETPLEPPKTEPAPEPPKTEPAPETTLEPPKTEPAPETMEPAKTEPAPEPAKTEPAKTEPAKTEPAKTEPAPEATFQVTIPAGLPPLPIPADNPMTAEKIELGKLLYFDTRLSKDGTISCATCHDPKEGWAERTPTSTGIADQVGGRNAPTVINAAYADAQFWDGRAPTLEAQALGPIENPIEMGHSLGDLVPQLNEVAGYKERFQKVFGTEVTADGMAKAIAAFERTVLSGNSPFDKFQAGDAAALNDAQKRGWELFEKAKCATCHKPPLFSNYKYYNAGVGADAEKPDGGRMDVTKDEKDKGKFRVPALRDAANTAPYFHNGSAATLEEAVAMMAAGGKDNDNLSAMLKAVRNAELTTENQKDIVEFLKALSGEFPIVEPPQLP